jgi:ABC-type transport system substrate-binding protein
MTKTSLTPLLSAMPPKAIETTRIQSVAGLTGRRTALTPDGKHITFALRKGVKFHDGSDFTCADAKYSLDKLADPKRAHRTFVAIMEKVLDGTTCTDDFTLVLNLKEPSAALLTMLAGAHAVMMKAGIAEQVDRKDPKFLVGTGPFKYKSYTPGVNFRAERNPNYWKSGFPYIDAYEAVVMPDLMRIFASFRARQLTMTRMELALVLTRQRASRCPMAPNAPQMSLRSDVLVGRR